MNELVLYGKVARSELAHFSTECSSMRNQERRDASIYLEVRSRTSKGNESLRDYQVNDSGFRGAWPSNIWFPFTVTSTVPDIFSPSGPKSTSTRLLFEEV